MGDGAHVERASISSEEHLGEKEESIIRPKIRVRAGSLKRTGFGRVILFRKNDESRYREFPSSKSGDNI